MTLTGIAAMHAQTNSPVSGLLDGATKVGGIYYLDYDKGIITTDDDLKKKAGGIARHSLLLAAAVKDPDAPTLDPDEEVLLLRVSGVASLPHQNELVATRLAAMQDMTYRVAGGASPIIDNWTQAQIQKAAFECRVLGTFYNTPTASGDSFLDWGADLDDVYASTRYYVFVPSPTVLSLLASYPRITEDEAAEGKTPALIRIGNVRYSSTRRRARDAHMATVPVDVRVTDFISRKTAVLGMTRAGKSNTNKTITTAIYKHAKDTNQKIGQLIFDPQGEYAAYNQQDQTALKLLSDSEVLIYRLGQSTDPQIKSLTVNFYDQTQVEVVMNIIEECLADDRGTGYVDAFLSSDYGDPDPSDYPNAGAVTAARNKVAWGRFALYATLHRAGYRAPSNWSGMTVQLASATAADLDVKVGRAVSTPGNSSGFVRFTSLQDVEDAMDVIAQECVRLTKAQSAGTSIANDPYEKFVKPGPFSTTRPVFDRTGGTKALNRLRDYTEFHSASASGDVTRNVIRDLQSGFIVIVDLSRGSERVAQRMSERIVRGVLDNGNRKFRAGQDPDKIQILVEEAHRLFDRRKADNDADPWVQLAKEAAKYEIGLMYATQEVTSVDPRILSATHNWVIAHLNSDLETRALSHYYDFADFADDIIKAEDRGFVRLKTMSGKYIVSVQIAKFDHAMVNDARSSAGLPPIPDPGAPVGAPLPPEAVEALSQSGGTGSAEGPSGPSADGEVVGGGDGQATAGGPPISTFAAMDLFGEDGA